MAHTIEEAKSGRASCRSCKKAIAKGELRFGEETINQFAGDGRPSLVWHHLACAAEKKPSQLKEAMATYTGEIANRAELEKTIADSAGKAKPAFPYAERAPTGRSKCIGCSEAIAKGDLRVAVEREVDTGAFVTKGAGYFHVGCSKEAIEDAELLAKLKANSRGLEDGDWAALEEELL